MAKKNEEITTQTKENRDPESNNPSAEISREEKAQIKNENKTTENKIEKKSLSQKISDLEAGKIRELHSIVSSRMINVYNNPAGTMSSISASFFRISGVSIDGFTVDRAKLEKCFPKVMGIWTDSARDDRSKLIGIATAFEMA